MLLAQKGRDFALRTPAHSPLLMSQICALLWVCPKSTAACQFSREMVPHWKMPACLYQKFPGEPLGQPEPEETVTCSAVAWARGVSLGFGKMRLPLDLSPIL